MYDARGIRPAAPARERQRVRYQRSRRSAMRQDLRRRLARAELAVAMDRADLEREFHLARLRLSVKICTYIRERLLLMGIDPTLAVGLRIGEEAAAELAADEAAAELATDELVTRGDVAHHTVALDPWEEKIERTVESFRNGERPDFATDSLVSLLAFCFAFDDGPNREPTS
jgi:hypothetical protein